MNCCSPIIATNAGGIPYIESVNTTIGTESIDIALPTRSIRRAGYMTVIITTVIPATATTTLPVTLSMAGTTRALTLPNGTPVTAAELVNVGVITVFNDRNRGLLALMSRTIA